MHHSTRPLTIAALLAAGSAAGAQAVDFNSHDSNGDGYLTESEWADANIDIRFDTIDTNRDGYLAEAEVEAGMAVQRRASEKAQDAAGESTSGESGEGDYVPAAIDPPVQDRPVVSEPEDSPQAVHISESEDQPRAVILYDENGDQRVSRSEARKDGELVTHFVIWDTNQDGYLDQAEIDSGDRQTDRDANAGDKTRQSTPPDASAAGMRAGNSTGTTAQFTMLDANADGLLDETEAAENEYVHTNFDAWDTDGDGLVSEKEADNGWMGGNGD